MHKSLKLGLFLINYSFGLTNREIIAIFATANNNAITDYRQLYMEGKQEKPIRGKAMVTGASGMLGGYVARELTGVFTVDTLGRGERNTFRCDLSREVPDLGERSYDLVVHCAGSEDDAYANLNSVGTRNLLDALRKERLPKYFVYVSSWSVYGEEGDNISEDAMLAPATPAARSKEKAEREVARWAQDHGVTLSIVRPARMFGTNVGGKTLRLFNDALNGSFIHIRGNNARTSLVTALDAARIIARIYQEGGVYNLADGCNPRFIDMMQAMTANAGREKRISTLPSSWAAWVWRLCRWIPAINRNLDPAVVAHRMKTLTIDGKKGAQAAGISYYNTIEVIARRDEDYPYDEK